MKHAVVEANPKSFAEFGRVVKHPSGTPTAQGPDFRFWSDLASYAIAGETEIGLCTVYRQPSPTIAGLERHLSTPEILIPVDAPFVLPLLSDGRPETELKAFRVGIGEAVVINAGVWHGPCIPVGKADATYFVIFRRGTPREDVEKKGIAPITLTL
jgi:ureidoglycolate hydrolase